MAPAALRDSNEQAGHVGRTRCCCCCGGTTHTPGTMECLGRVCRRRHASRSRSLLSGRSVRPAAALHCQRASLTLLSRLARSLYTQPKETPDVPYSRFPVRESCIPGVDTAVLARSTHVSRLDRGRLEWLRSALCMLHAWPGMPRGRRHSQVPLIPTGVCVHAAMCLALTLGRRCGLAGVCLCQNCVRFSPRPASSKLS